ncbi:hypothetical protein DPF_0538 [Desulfoplanes formicivorans]|uniref:DUF485 domain-containing protein n=2 Tax=Desulfoplanes formicivorans TaxID=1592317 RepID=A0A194AGD3_9BACT|nr:hypothetical protein DPF_0538 [Desulfoplanes formicivorans]
MDVNTLRKKQLTFALAFGIPYFVSIIGLYLLVYLAKDWIAGQTLGGMPLHYVLVGLVIYPVTWIIFIIYTKAANAMEDTMQTRHPRE